MAPTSGALARPPPYLLDNRAPQTSRRFSSLSQIWDPWTIQHLELVGIRRGGNCLEVGAGSGSIARWLAERVGPEGHVLATDIDPRHLRNLSVSNLEVREHNIATESVVERAFDLVHSRLVLQHVPERVLALKKMVRALKPGGWILAEDFAGQVPFDPPGDRENMQLLRRAGLAMGKLIRKRGGDPLFGRSLVRLLLAEGLRSVGADVFVTLSRGRSPFADLLVANFRQIRGELLKHRLLSGDEVRRLFAFVGSPDFARYSPMMLSAWGRRRA